MLSIRAGNHHDGNVRIHRPDFPNEGRARRIKRAMNNNTSDVLGPRNLDRLLGVFTFANHRLGKFPEQGLREQESALPLKINHEKYRSNDCICHFGGEA